MDETNQIENAPEGIDNSNEFENTINLGMTKSPRATWIDRKPNNASDKLSKLNEMMGKKRSVDVDK